jgi:hypothetical protein
MKDAVRARLDGMTTMLLSGMTSMLLSGVCCSLAVTLAIVERLPRFAGALDDREPHWAGMKRQRGGNATPGHGGGKGPRSTAAWQM